MTILGIQFLRVKLATHFMTNTIYTNVHIIFIYIHTEKDLSTRIYLYGIRNRIVNIRY